MELSQTLQNIADSVDIFSLDGARKLDQEDPIAYCRKRFAIPKNCQLPEVNYTRVDPSRECIYMAGHSLGLKTARVDEYLNIFLKMWLSKGVTMHTDDKFPIVPATANVQDGIDGRAQNLIAEIIGALPNEVAVMNSLTVNLHLAMINFYRPTSARYKILIEEDAFPSDRLRLHGRTEEALIKVSPRPGEHCIREEDILGVIEENGPAISVVILPGVQFLTGQLFNMERITEACHRQGCVVGWDLAHAVGNASLRLHDWNVDFACWCSYKYLNSGTGGIAGIFVHSMHFGSDLVALRGWWGNRIQTRFEMREFIDCYECSEGWKLSTAPCALIMMHLAALEDFREVGLKQILRKQKLLTGYLEVLLDNLRAELASNSTSGGKVFDQLTPRDPSQRGSQISISFGSLTPLIFHALKEFGVVCDLRKDKVIRVAPVPLYNSFEDVYLLIQYLRKSCNMVMNPRSEMVENI